jgi:hypothetical protein
LESQAGLPSAFLDPKSPLPQALQRATGVPFRLIVL